MSLAEVPAVVYVHGAGNKPPRDDLKLAWDLDLFGRDMGQATRMAHYADLLHPTPGAIGADACTQEEALAVLVLAAGAADASAGEAPPSDEADLLAGLTARGQQLALSLSISMAAQAASRPPTVEESLAAVLPCHPRCAACCCDSCCSTSFPTQTPTSSPTGRNRSANGYVRHSMRWMGPRR